MKRCIRVLVVDDSAFARRALSRRLASDPQIEVVDTAVDGMEALAKTRDLKPDVVTMDVQMPGMDGLTALRRIMCECPTPVVMVTAMTATQERLTIEALELGAVDFFLKPSLANPAGFNGTSEDLIDRVKTASRVKGTGDRMLLVPGHGTGRSVERGVRPHFSRLSKVVVIGSSTGGPRALCAMVPSLPAAIPAALLIVQHMPPGFTRSLAERLNEASAIEVREAWQGDALRPGLALVAPGGFHMVVTRRGEVDLNQDPPVCGVRPSVDVTMESVARAYGADSVGVVLTGMGSDGTSGAGHIISRGGRVLVEDESTCTVYGMPRSVAQAGSASAVVPLPKMAREIALACAIDRGVLAGGGS